MDICIFNFNASGSVTFIAKPKTEGVDGLQNGPHLGKNNVHKIPSRQLERRYPQSDWQRLDALAEDRVQLRKLEETYAEQ